MISPCVHIAASADHVSRLVQGTNLQYHADMHGVLARVMKDVPEEHAASLGSVYVNPSKDDRIRGSYHPRSYSTRNKKWKPAYITMTPHVMDAPAYNKETTQQEKWGILRKSGLPAQEVALHHEVGHHLYTQMNRDKRDAMWNEVGDLPEFKKANPQSAQPVSPRFVASNKSSLTKHVSAYAATSHDEAAAELYAQHYGKYSTPASHIVFRHLTGGAHDDQNSNEG